MATKVGWWDILLLCIVGGGCIAFVTWFGFWLMT